jgi:hypothetical protein
MIALTDHNTCRNAEPFASACRQHGIVPLFGAEATSSEEAHVLGIFGDPDAGLEFGERLYASLPDFHPDPARYGDQVVVDQKELIVEELPKGLIGASGYSIHELGVMIHELGGLFIPAHIDRTAFSVWSQLGFLPPDSYDAVEVLGHSERIDPVGYTAVCNSDAHHPEHVARRYFSYKAASPSLMTLRDALRSGSVQLHGL